MKKIILSIIFMLSLSCFCFATQEGEGKGNIYGGGNTVIDKDGNVGIGTTSPSEKLNVVGDVLVTGGIQQVYSHIVDQKNPNTNGGTFTSGDWRIRDINTELDTYDPNFEISLSTFSQITLSTGTWEVYARCPAYNAGSHKAILFNVDGGSMELNGSSVFCAAASDVSVDSVVQGIFTILATKVFELKHRCSTTSADIGLGFPSDFSVPEIYSEIIIKKLSD